MLRACRPWFSWPWSSRPAARLRNVLAGTPTTSPNLSAAMALPTAPRIRGWRSRLVASLTAGVFLAQTLYAPQAHAIIPAGVWAAMAVRGVVAGAVRKAAIPAAGSAATALSASGLFGVSAAAYIVLCGSNYVSGNDCSGTPLAKLRPQGHTGADGESAASTIPATNASYSATATSGMFRIDSDYGAFGCRAGATGYVYATSQAACEAMAASGRIDDAYTGSCAYTGSAEAVAPYPASGQLCKFNIYGPTGSTLASGAGAGSTVTSGTGYTCPGGGTLSGTTCQLYTCPSGYTLTGTNCVPGSTTWASDGTPSYRNQAGAWIADPNDPDAAAPMANPVVANVTSPEGQPMKVEIQAMPDGSIKVRTFTQGQLNGQTTTSVNELSITSSGTPTATTNIYYGDVTTVYNQTPPASQTPAPQVEIPTDYAREGTLQENKAETKRAADELKKLNDEGLKIKEDGTPEGKSEAQTALEGRLSRGGNGGNTESGSVYPDDDGIRKVIAPGAELENKRAATDAKTSSSFNWAESCQDITIGPRFTLPICGSEGAEWLRLALAWVYGLGGVVYLYRRSSDVLSGEH